MTDLLLREALRYWRSVLNDPRVDHRSRKVAKAKVIDLTERLVEAAR